MLQLEIYRPIAAGCAFCPAPSQLSSAPPGLSSNILKEPDTALCRHTLLSYQIITRNKTREFFLLFYYIHLAVKKTFSYKGNNNRP